MSAGEERPHGTGRTWSEAFPHWDPLVDTVPVQAETEVRQASPEELVETVLEVASAYRTVSDHALGELYPLVPARFRFRRPGEKATIPFSSVAASPAVDVAPSRSRAAGRTLHQTFALANAAAAVNGTADWPDDEVLSAFGTAFFGLNPVDFYSLVIVAIGGRDRRAADEYLAHALDGESVETVVKRAAQAVFDEVLEGDVVDWLSSLPPQPKVYPHDLRDSHPQLLRLLPLLDVTLIEALGAVLPSRRLDAGAFLKGRHEERIGLSAGDAVAVQVIRAGNGVATKTVATALGVSEAQADRMLITHGAVVRRADLLWYPRTALFSATSAPPPSRSVEPSVAPAEPEPTATTVEPEPAQDTERAETEPVAAAREPETDRTSPTVPVTGAAARRGDTSGFSVDDWEAELVRSLEGASLVAQADLSETELTSLIDLYAARYRLSRERQTTVKQFVRNYPASTLVVLVGLAATEFESNTYWSAAWDRLGVEPRQYDENAMRHSIPGLLALFGLDPIDGLRADAYVQRLAIHAGIPAASFDKLLDVLTSYVAGVIAREDRPFHDWILEPSHDHLLHTLDAPTRSFISYGGATAHSFLQKLADVVARASERIGSSEEDLESAGTELPQLVEHALREAFARADIGERVRSRRRQARSVPSVHLEADDTIVIRLPAPVSHSSAQWTITLDAEVRHLHPDRVNGNRHVDVPLERPTRRIVVTHPSYANPIEMRLYDPERPLVFFGTDGAHLPTTARLPRDEVLVVAPDKLEVRGEGSLAPRVIGAYGSPPGWDGWSLRHWDLSETDSVRVQYKDNPAIDLELGTRELPYLDDSDGAASILDGVLYERLPVHGARPWIVLPALRTTEVVPWTVRYRPSGATEWTEQGTHSSEERVSWKLFEGEDGVLLGRFDIRVTGPDGARFDHSIVLAEGLEIEYDDDIRMPEGDGLTEFGATLSSDVLTISPTRLDFDESTSTQTVTVSNRRRTEKFVVRPPRLEFRLTAHGSLPAWSDRLIGRHPDDFSQATLAVRGVPEDVRLRAVLMGPSGKPLARIALADSPRAGVRLASTSPLVDAARKAQAGTLELELEYPTAGTWTAELVRFSTVGIGVTVHLVDREFHISRLGTNDRVALHVWQLDRPWRQPVSLPVDENRAQLPESLAGAGRLRVQPVVEDDWDPVPPERFPGSNSFLIERTGDFGTGATAGLSRFLSEEVSYPGVGAKQPEVWVALAHLSRHVDRGDSDKFTSLSSVVCRDPRTALISLASAELPTNERLALFLETGLVYQTYAVSAPGWRRSAVASEPWIDLLLAMCDAPNADAELRLWLLKRITEIGGTSLAAILENGVDPIESTAVIDKGAVMLSGQPDTLREALEKQKVVPGALVDEASRYDGYLSLFEHCRFSTPEYLLELFRLTLGQYQSPMKALKKYPGLRSRVEVRSEALDGLDPADHGWACAPYVSFALALHARLRAHGMLSTNAPDDLPRYWGEFARREPLQAMIDLLAAEGYVQHQKYSGRPVNPFARESAHTDLELVSAIIGDD